MQYEIETKLGGTDQVGLRLKCNEAQAENIYLKLRQQELRLSGLMPSNHSGYDYFLYVTGTEFQLRQMMSQIQISFNPDIAIAPTQTRAAATQNFKAWQTQFRQAVKTLNKESESPYPTSSTQEIDQNRRKDSGKGRRNQRRSNIQPQSRLQRLTKERNHRTPLTTASLNHT